MLYKMSTPRRKSNPLWVAGAILLLLWIIPFGGLVLLPLQYLNTHIHELSHAVAALASGGQGMNISVFPDGSGVTQFQGGWTILVAPAGYVGATIVGASLILAGRTAQNARKALYALAVVLALGLLLWVRNALGFGTGIVYFAGVLLLAKNLSDDHVRIASQFLGLHQCVASAQALLVLLNINTFGHQQNDAAILAQATGVPAIVWAGSWALVSAAVVVTALRRAA